MNKQKIESDPAPSVAVGPYSQAISTGNLLFTSGQVPIDPKSGKIPEGSIEEHTHLVFKNMTAIVEASGTSLEKAVKTTIYLKDINDFKAVNNVYSQHFKEPYSAKQCFPSRCASLWRFNSG